MEDKQSTPPAPSSARGTRIHETIHSKKMEGIHCGTTTGRAATVQHVGQTGIATRGRDQGVN